MGDWFRIKGDAIPRETRVAAVEGSESLSQPYLFSIDLAMPGGAETPFEASETIGKRVSLTIVDESETVRGRIHGILAAAELLHELPTHALYRVEMVPALWLFSLGRHGRVFVDKATPEIVETLLREGGLRSGDDYELRLRGRYPSNEHTCEYGESHLDFISRLCEREGIYYFFEQGDDREKLIFTDDKSQHKKLGDDPLPYFPLLGEAPRAHEALYSFRCRLGALPQSVKVTDYDYLHPTREVAEEAAVADLGTGEQWFFGENFMRDEVGKRLARVRAEGLRARAERYVGAGHVYEVRSGYTFKLVDHPNPALNQEYLVVSVAHRGLQAGVELGFHSGLDPSEAAGYRVEILAIPAATQYRPERRTPVPRIYGLEPAIVDGPAGHDYAQIDDFGRYLVKLRFDESGLKEGKASTRVRMLQPHAGNPEGFHFPLRKGTEVLLAFMGGDPDRPVIAGAIANAHNPNLVSSRNHTQNVLQTGGQSRIEIEDQAGQQYLALTTVPQKSELHLGAPHGKSPQHQHNFELLTDGSGLIHTGTDHDLKVDRDMTTEIKGKRTETIHKGDTRHILDGGLQEDVKGKVHRDLNGSIRDVDLAGNVTDHIKGQLNHTSDLGTTFSTPKAFAINGDEGITLTTKKACTVNAPNGLHTIGDHHTETHEKHETTSVTDELMTNSRAEYAAFKRGYTGVGMESAAMVTGLAGVKIEKSGYKKECGEAKTHEFSVSFDNAEFEVTKGKVSIKKCSLTILD